VYHDVSLEHHGTEMGRFCDESPWLLHGAKSQDLVHGPSHFFSRNSISLAIRASCSFACSLSDVTESSMRTARSYAE